ncbi:MAG: Aromatic-L-amino-acid decarboxylase [uncultured Thermomicrobiales bacterium]|uniref:Aromatic-L-amino-acid decarboxylase n=1 Tax=uncultured Thermomicrobiales bacterium TaxID=1645740 RepID=A0A6J4UW23_9BACT|nr:MAG: Aromatic-L-amino-acid decarboxylase [uncultured Thermomicrobiales bacterium]
MSPPLPRADMVGTPVAEVRSSSDAMAGADPFAALGPALDAAREIAGTYLDGLRDRPVSRAATVTEMAAALDQPLPETGTDAAAAVREWFERAGPGIVASPGPRFFGFVNGGSLPAALAGDWLASALDQNLVAWVSSPAGAQTETVVIRWLLDLFGLPPGWDGTLTTGATMANLVGLAAARQWVGERMGFDPAADGLSGNPRIPVVVSSLTHASIRKALATLGLGRTATIEIPAVGGALDPAGVREALAGLDGPAIVVAGLGEVNTGASDDLAAIADARDTHAPGAWLHVDAAFGLFAALSPRTAELVIGVERADSVATDGHKWLNVPYDCGVALLRDGATARTAFAAGASYLAPAAGDGPAPSALGPEMSRRMRALPVWCALRSAGRAGYRAMVERCLDNAAAFAAWVGATPGLELLAPAPTIIVCFRVAPAGMDDTETDEVNRRVVAGLQADGRAFVSGTVWEGKAAIRAAFDNWATGPADVAILQAAILDVAARESTGLG